MEERTQKTLLLGALGTAACLAALSLGGQFSVLEGDPSIHLVFAKSMFRDGFMHYGPSGASTGTSSPFWSFLLAFFYLFDSEPVVSIKIFSLLIFFAVALFIYLAGARVAKSEAAGLLPAGLWLFDAHAQRYALVYFETDLAVLLVLTGIYLLLRLSQEEAERSGSISFWALAAVLSVAVITRFELVIWAGLTILTVLYLKGRGAAAKLKFAAIAFAPLMLYALWGWMATGRLLPSSAAGRISTNQNLARGAGVVFDIFSFSKDEFGLPIPAFVKVLIPVSIIGYLLLKGPLRFYLTATVLIYFALFMWVFPVGDLGYAIRYLFPVLMPVFLVALSFLIGRVWDYLPSLQRRAGPIMAVLLLLMCWWLSGTWRQRQWEGIAVVGPRPNVTLRELMLGDLADWLNPVSTAEDRVLLYEIQGQYYLTAKTLSLDGIVGGEILPYLRARSDLADFLQKYRPRYWVARDEMDYRTEYSNTILKQVWDRRASVPVGAELTLANITFKKILINTAALETKPAERARFVGWREVWQLEYAAPG